MGTLKTFHRIVDRLPVNVVRILLNRWRPFKGSGIKVTYISPDYKRCDASLTLRWYNRNYVGVHFGGSLFSLADPWYMLILLQNIGKDYIVWDKAGRIEFKKPARGVIRASCEFSDEELAAIRAEADKNGKYIFDRDVDLFDENNEVVATVTKTLYVKRKDLIK